MRTIVVGYIPTPEGRAALTAAITHARDTRARLVVVNTGHNGDYADPSFASSTDLEALDARLAEAGIEHEIQQPTRSLPAAEEILDAVDRERADLVVIGMRRRSVIGKLVTGSTAQEVLLGAECPVLAVKARRSS